MQRRRIISTALFLATAVASAAHAQKAPAITLTKELVIDGVENDFVDIWSIVPLSNGSIALSEAGDLRVRWFNSAGAPIYSTGRRGGGPGEFKNMARIGTIADSVWVYDATLKRFTVLSPKGSVIRTFPTPLKAKPPKTDRSQMPVFTPVFPRGLRADGSIFALLLSNEREAMGARYRNGSVYGIVDSTGTVRSIATIVTNKPSGIELRDDKGKVIASTGTPFYNAPLDAVSPSGHRYAIANADVDGDHAGTFSLVLAGQNGQLLFNRRFKFEPEPIPRSVADSTVRERAKRLSQDNPELAALFKSRVKIPPMYPPITGLTVGSDGSTWVRMRRTAAGLPYYRISPAGVHTGTLFLPRGAFMVAATGTHVWLIELDEDDVQSAVRYRINNPR